MQTFAICSLILCLGTINLCTGQNGCKPGSGAPSTWKMLCCDDHDQLRTEIPLCHTQANT
ncbi:uncharacterized protein PGTG_21824 [Puccinia graminis f. sp. tritici CRL 75-36-700-3]|uniref:Uncharacterized protein n=1 Tax=Puccinia graminis f. sp. tritici (strain CRL 75-36-700-3 / race SCCL) TaxID=418459 RepID=H6QSL0_PUCGT|nr:uncharacterized protein PGTG_21824 [Puccinia graminis f. sp. tritici CRL 75-36-700-3]EHS63732.1 hypothetical protein PGTG_21824 [Puccinia graminis f. sp. tritici CRL 75-36-700-3]